MPLHAGQSQSIGSAGKHRGKKPFFDCQFVDGKIVGPKRMRPVLRSDPEIDSFILLHRVLVVGRRVAVPESET